MDPVIHDLVLVRKEGRFGPSEYYRTFRGAFIYALFMHDHTFLVPSPYCIFEAAMRNTVDIMFHGKM